MKAAAVARMLRGGWREERLVTTWLGTYFFLLWIVFIFGVGAIADSKHRSSSAWGLCAFFFGPPVVLIVGFLEPLPRKESRAVPTDRAKDDEGRHHLIPLDAAQHLPRKTVGGSLVAKLRPLRP